MKDLYSRRINYMRISITDLCNLRCQYCMPAEGICKKDHKEVLTLEEITDIVKAGVGLGIDKVRITGGEPLVRNGIVEFIQMISNIDGIKDIAITTNGILLPRYAEALKEAGLKRVNISIDSLNPDKYREITRGGDLSKVLEGINECIRLGLTPVKLNVVAIGGYNDDEIEDFIQLTMDKPIDVRFIELMPIGEASQWGKDRFISNEEIVHRFKNLVPMETEKSSPAKYYQLPGGMGRVGLINPISSHFCGDCNRVRLTSDGKLKPCLHSNHEIDILDAVRNHPEKIQEVLASAILSKPEKHDLLTDSHEESNRGMSQIGG
ncbi:GTP 3',8-cyclase MoaA [Alkaliphilus oremlandii]|uniref:GTP 3',8-cyclase n=1 Tax=Alkaliphilus oremlandii (strain OhILAs) TaxID=350688 RepID=MOAA_ALKOO|nr:GTP 3',8-cyclase MoaA [Alkaliphilus oremlandii]A8MLW5.1 RecName: Full=GTP 3',8-cyclase; AltName: Full=Molybdenum cofactor biosynthesis protein A [Alkaliphilus oremlandii OhILAs]ABW18132.1 molybdenum cofactor biosynthesis protein A [Alkaliphilus oremlandii OhILAs]